MNFVKEAKIHEMSETCNKFIQLQNLLGNDKLLTEMSFIKQTIEDVKNVIGLPSDDEGICVVCKSERSMNIIIPCGHQCVCELCAKEIHNRCPYCQTQFTSINKVFVV